jgi:hypothetical protein
MLDTTIYKPMFLTEAPVKGAQKLVLHVTPANDDEEDDKPDDKKDDAKASVDTKDDDTADNKTANKADDNSEDGSDEGDDTDSEDDSMDDDSELDDDSMDDDSGDSTSDEEIPDEEFTSPDSQESEKKYLLFNSFKELSDQVKNISELIVYTIPNVNIPEIKDSLEAINSEVNDILDKINLVVAGDFDKKDYRNLLVTYTYLSGSMNQINKFISTLLSSSKLKSEKPADNSEN